jgi:hypothetical protein
MVDFLKKNTCYKIVNKGFEYFDKQGNNFSQEEIKNKINFLDKVDILMNFDTEVPLLKEDFNEVINKKPEEIITILESNKETFCKLYDKAIKSIKAQTESKKTFDNWMKTLEKREIITNEITFVVNEINIILKNDEDWLEPLESDKEYRNNGKLIYDLIEDTDYSFETYECFENYIHNNNIINNLHNIQELTNEESYNFFKSLNEENNELSNYSQN